MAVALDPNDYQVGGDHYRKTPGEQHWDRVARLKLNYFQAMITRYVERYRDKNGIEDLKKAKHFLEKLISLEEQGWDNRQPCEAKDEADDRPSATRPG